MRNCKHETAAFSRWRDGAWVFFATAPSSVQFTCDRMICVACGAWLPLGPANDDDPRVKVEISGIDLADSYRSDNRRPGPDRFDYCPDTDSAALCERCESLYLAHCIVNHDENRETE